MIFTLTLIWALIYDTAYAIADLEDDLKLGIKSTAILFGEKVQWIVGAFQLIMLAGFVWLGQLFDLGWRMTCPFWSPLRYSSIISGYCISNSPNRRSGCF